MLLHLIFTEAKDWRWEKKTGVIFECPGCTVLQPHPKYMLWLSFYAGSSLYAGTVTQLRLELLTSLENGIL